MNPQYHHYIPRFLLRNFAIDKYERVFEGNIKQQQRKGRRKNKGLKKESRRKAEILQTYDRKKEQLGTSLIGETYGYRDMYKDFNNNDVMHVEEKLSKLECRASKTIKDILEASQEQNQVVLLRKDLEDLRKFIFIMNYRNGHRWRQFTGANFDPSTRSMVKDFMQQQNLKRPEEVWLQNIREILDTPHHEVKDNMKIFKVDRDDYKQRMIEYFLVIWQAGENDEFIVTSNGFGIFEGVTGTIFGSPFGFAYHSFYVISPKLVLVLCPSFFRKEVGQTEILYKMFNGQRSIFENVPHPAAIPKHVGRVNASRSGSNDEPKFDITNLTDPFDLKSHLFDAALKANGIKRHMNDEFTFSFVKIDSATVHLVNAILLNEVGPDLVLTFVSHSYLYKTIVKYHNHYEDSAKKDFTNLKKKLRTELNRTHEDDLHLRKNVPASSTFTWNVREMIKNHDKY
ncbi:14504_t:CDS:1 [Acaulospora morrowiae]|uniref:14504_t:CDS:1 n=1 Tax=Acaulospora morrowiae TaxID=94023 RepID=A0A9N9A643_9GLOM|nr:14504_t:CDS:1 [Acaulospora morrowiae]